MKAVNDLPPLPLSDDEILEALRDHYRHCVTDGGGIHRVIVSPDGTITHWSAPQGAWDSVCGECRCDPCECGGVPYDYLLMQSEGCHPNDWDQRCVPVSWRDEDLNVVKSPEGDDRKGEWYFGLPNNRETASFDEVVEWYVDDHMDTVDLQVIKEDMRKCFFGSEGE